MHRDEKVLSSPFHNEPAVNFLEELDFVTVQTKIFHFVLNKLSLSQIILSHKRLQVDYFIFFQQ